MTPWELGRILGGVCIQPAAIACRCEEGQGSSLNGSDRGQDVSFVPIRQGHPRRKAGPQSQEPHVGRPVAEPPKGSG
jgi:hypothetical protein